MHHLIACKFDTCTKKFKYNKLINCMVKEKRQLFTWLCCNAA